MVGRGASSHSLGGGASAAQPGACALSPRRRPRARVHQGRPRARCYCDWWNAANGLFPPGLDIGAARLRQVPSVRWRLHEWVFVWKPAGWSGVLTVYETKQMTRATESEMFLCTCTDQKMLKFNLNFRQNSIRLRNSLNFPLFMSIIKRTINVIMIVILFFWEVHKTFQNIIIINIKISLLSSFIYF